MFVCENAHECSTVNLPNVGHSPNVGQNYICNSVLSFQDLWTYYIPLESPKNALL